MSMSFMPSLSSFMEIQAPPFKMAALEVDSNVQIPSRLTRSCQDLKSLTGKYLTVRPKLMSKKKHPYLLQHLSKTQFYIFPIPLCLFNFLLLEHIVLTPCASKKPRN